MIPAWVRAVRLEARNMVASNPQLVRRRNDTVAKSFFRELRSQGFSHNEIIELSAKLLDLVTKDIKAPAQS